MRYKSWSGAFGVRRGIAALVFSFYAIKSSAVPLLALPFQKKYQSGDPSPHSKTGLVSQRFIMPFGGTEFKLVPRESWFPRAASPL
jgi:hypothetical protein